MERLRSVKEKRLRGAMGRLGRPPNAARAPLLHPNKDPSSALLRPPGGVGAAPLAAGPRAASRRGPSPGAASRRHAASPPHSPPAPVSLTHAAPCQAKRPVHQPPLESRSPPTSPAVLPCVAGHTPTRAHPSHHPQLASLPDHVRADGRRPAATAARGRPFFVWQPRQQRRRGRRRRVARRRRAWPPRGGRPTGRW